MHIFSNKMKIFSYFTIWIVLAFLCLKTKEIVLSTLANNNLQEIHGKFFSLYEVHNYGASFNFFSGQQNELILFALICIILLSAIVILKTSKLPFITVIMTAFLSCGMSVNTYERINQGYVTDYIYFTFFKSFPVFNLPDVLIVTGTFCLMLFLLTNKKDKKEE